MKTKVVYPRCAGLNVPKKTVVASAISSNANGDWDKEIARFSTKKARIIVAQIGIDMSRFPSSSHLAVWAGVASGNYASAGKQ